MLCLTAVDETPLLHRDNALSRSMILSTRQFVHSDAVDSTGQANAFETPLNHLSDSTRSRLFVVQNSSIWPYLHRGTILSTSSLASFHVSCDFLAQAIWSRAKAT